MKHITILVVDDTVENLDVLENLLVKYDLVFARSGKDALEILKKEKINLILLDIVMPNMDGYKVCKILKQDIETKDIPIIFITAKTDEDSIEKAYEVGGSDYVTKPFKPRELLARIKRELQLQELQMELKHLALTDSMTKLYNRRYFITMVEHSFDLAKREKQNLSIIILDIDKFKNINDTYGHKIGDDIIIHLANILLKYQRESDIVCRYGGDEFVIVLPNTSLKGSEIVAQKLRDSTESLIIKLPLNQNLKFTISLGISGIDIRTESNIELALKRADDALYIAKQKGRNRVEIQEIC